MGRESWVSFGQLLWNTVAVDVLGVSGPCPVVYEPVGGHVSPTLSHQFGMGFFGFILVLHNFFCVSQHLLVLLVESLVDDLGSVLQIGIFAVRNCILDPVVLVRVSVLLHVSEAESTNDVSLQVSKAHALLCLKLVIVSWGSLRPVFPLVGLFIQKVQLFVWNNILTVLDLQKLWISLARPSEASVSGDVLMASPIMDDLRSDNEFLYFSRGIKISLSFGISFLVDNPLGLECSCFLIYVLFCETLDRLFLLWSILLCLKSLP